MPFQRAKLYDEIAYSVVTEQGRIPAVISDSGDGSYVGISEKYPIQGYHRVLSSDSQEYDNGYGDGNNIIVETLQIVMVVTNDREVTKTKGVDLARFIKAGFRSTLTEAEINTVGIDQVVITTGQTTLDREEVISNEYVDLKKLPEQYDVFSIAYQIELTIDKNCLQLCEA